MHWADNFAKQIIKRKKKKEYVIESGITPSGVVHAGNFREIMTQDLVYKALLSQGVKAKYQYIWDDYDRFRKVPKGISKEWEQYIGLPVTKTPDPWGCHDFYADHFKEKIIKESELCGVNPTFISMTEKYEKCAFAENMKTALENASVIQEILNNFRKTPHPKDWLPVRVYCEKCGKDTTKVIYPGEYTLNYECECGKTGSFDFRKKGLAKMPWRVCWAQRWQYYDVDFESSGKDHKASGGSWDTGTRICKQVFKHNPPLGPMYEFIYAKGQKEKMSSSMGNVFTVSDLLQVYEPEMVRYIYTAKISKAIEVPFGLDVINKYEYFDKAERIFFEKESTGNEKDDETISRSYELSQITKPVETVQPPFAFCANIAQVYNSTTKAITVMQRTGHLPKKLSKQDKDKIKLRLNRAKTWVDNYAPSNVKITVLKDIPDVKLSSAEKKALAMLSELKVKDIGSNIPAIAEKTGLKTKQVFASCYKVILGRPSGPRLQDFLLTLDEEFVRNRLALKA